MSRARKRIKRAITIAAVSSLLVLACFDPLVAGFENNSG
jgi:hypothetical protein